MWITDIGCALLARPVVAGMQCRSSFPQESPQNRDDLRKIGISINKMRWTHESTKWVQPRISSRTSNSSEIIQFLLIQIAIEISPISIQQPSFNPGLQGNPYDDINVILEAAYRKPLNHWNPPIFWHQGDGPRCKWSSLGLHWSARLWCPDKASRGQYQAERDCCRHVGLLTGEIWIGKHRTPIHISPIISSYGINMDLLCFSRASIMIPTMLLAIPK